MSVDFYSCDCCEESRYEEFVHHCDKCGHSLGTCCVVNDDIGSSYAHDYCVKFDGTKEMMEEYGINEEYIEKEWVVEGEVIDDTGIDPKYCPFCNKTSVSDDDLLRYLIRKHEIDKDELIEEYKKSF